MEDSQTVSVPVGIRVFNRESKLHEDSFTPECEITFRVNFNLMDKNSITDEYKILDDLWSKLMILPMVVKPN